MKISVTLAAAAAAAASAIAFAAHAAMGHEGPAACLPEITAATALVATAVALGLKSRAKASA